MNLQSTRIASEAFIGDSCCEPGRTGTFDSLEKNFSVEHTTIKELVESMSDGVIIHTDQFDHSFHHLDHFLN